MKVLWISNIILSDLCKLLGCSGSVSGGWLTALAQPLSVEPDIELAIAVPQGRGAQEEYRVGKIRFFTFPVNPHSDCYCPAQEKAFVEIRDRFHPDVVHIHGSEYPHALAAANAFGAEHTVISIQGLVSVCWRYYYGGIPWYNLLRNTTLRDIVRGDTVFQQRHRMRRRAEFEVKLLKKASHVIGRTDWDAAHVLAINPELHYHHGDEVLRPHFFQESWSRKECIEHSVLVPQSQYPIKGLHQALPAFAILRKKYPDLKINIIGNPTQSSHFWRQNGYRKYLNTLIEKLDLASCIRFTGMLDEEAMCREFLRCHVAISPSAIENSSNVLCEAQLLGVPCVVSCVGGAISLVSHEKTGLMYRYEEPEALAFQIDRIFSCPELAATLSRREREVALVRHDPTQNVGELIKIYHGIL